MGAVPALGQHTASVLAEFQAGQGITGPEAKHGA
jgi:hypothetical protein